MKTYEDELRELMTWFVSEEERIEQIPYEGGLDGGGTTEGAQMIRKFDREIKAIAARHGVTEEKRSLNDLINIGKEQLKKA
jgi:hypothetical protein